MDAHDVKTARAYARTRSLARETPKAIRAELNHARMTRLAKGYGCAGSPSSVLSPRCHARHRAGKDRAHNGECEPSNVGDSCRSLLSHSRSMGIDSARFLMITD
jgi:hypothetical protein